MAVFRLDPSDDIAHIEGLIDMCLSDKLWMAVDALHSLGKRLDRVTYEDPARQRHVLAKYGPAARSVTDVLRHSPPPRAIARTCSAGTRSTAQESHTPPPQNRPTACCGGGRRRQEAAVDVMTQDEGTPTWRKFPPTPPPSLPNPDRGSRTAASRPRRPPRTRRNTGTSPRSPGPPPSTPSPRSVTLRHHARVHARVPPGREAQREEPVRPRRGTTRAVETFDASFATPFRSSLWRHARPTTSCPFIS